MYFRSDAAADVHKINSKFTSDGCRSEASGFCSKRAYDVRTDLRKFVAERVVLRSMGRVRSVFSEYESHAMGGVSASVVAFGFLCLRGSGIRHH